MSTADQPTSEQAAAHQTGTDSGPDNGPEGTAPASSRFDPASLVAGIVFLGMALAFAVADLDSLEDQVRFVWPTSLLALGLGLLLGTRRR